MRIRSFRNEKHKQYYFRVFDQDEQLLRSEAYNSKAARDNGIDSFKKNAPIPERYERLTSADGKFYFNVKAANHQVVATSLMFGSEDKREAVIEAIIAYAKGTGNSGRVEDEYMEVSFYESSGTDTSSGFDRFQKGEDNSFYFSFKSDDGKVLLLSQSYKQESGRDNGIESVEKNGKIEERYSTHTTEDGKFYFTLKAGNHQEIARSVDFDSEDEMKLAMSILMNGGGSMTTSGDDNTASDSKEQDDYMNAEFYQDSGTDVGSGFDRFQKGDAGLSYFSFKSDDGRVLLLSQGYTQESGRDNGIASVEKNGTIEKRYSTHTTEDGKFYFTLKAGNHQEIARSVDFDSEDEMKRAMNIIMQGGGSMSASDASTGSDSKEQDDYMELGFYQDSGTDVGSGFDRFQKGDAGLSYFSFKSDDGKVLLLSQGYTQESGRDNGIASVEKNGKIEKRYSTHTTEDGKFYFTLKAGNHQEIARSVDFDSEDEMKRAMSIIMQGGGSMVETATQETPKSSGDGMDDYRTFGFYKDSGTGIINGWDKFYSEKHGEYYFSYKQDGEPIIISEGYTTEAARDNGMASVEKNWGIEKRYKVHETASGRFYYTLRAGNHQEIARSRWFSSAEDRDASVGWLMAGGIGTVAAGASSSSTEVESETSTTTEEVGTTATPIMETTAAVALAGGVAAAAQNEGESSSEPEDDYLPCKEYEGHEVNDKVNNVAFFKHENGQFYFVIYKEDGSVRLRSEGFRSAKDRDSELSGLLKNLDNEEMYETIKRGKYSIHILRDKTGREVGRSCLEKEADEPVAVPVEETATTAAAVAATAAMVSTTSNDEVVASDESVEVTVEDKDDDYLPCRAYEGHDINDKVNNVAFFKHENGQFYFVVYKEDGSVRLRSEGFKTAKERDVELSGMLKNIDNPDMYETLEKGKYRLHILRDATGREVGRSCLETVEEETAAPVIETATAATVAAAATTAVTTVTTEEPEPEDDYLPCKEYEGHEISDKENNVAFFKKDGQYYFVIYKADGKTVRLRSEGFRNSRGRDVELSAALKNMNDVDRYKTITRGKYSLHILHDEDGREVGRSCLETESVGAVISSGTAAAAAAAAAAAVVTTEEVTPEIEVEQEEVVPVVEEEAVVVPPPVVETTAAAKTAATTATVAETAASGGLGIWKWLIPLLLFLGALYFMRGCFGCGGKTTDTASVTPPIEKPVEKVTPPPVVVDTVEKEEVVEVAPPPTCNCTGSSNIIFNIPSSSTPKVLTRLGTNPEFGNSHSLDAAGFYNKLKNAYSSNSRDKRFLDNMFKAMGYNNGFAAASSDMFSSTRVAAGTVGNMGYSEKHRTVYAKLDASGRDLDAFRIKAANGCDIHFMKTCGNHFFFCPN